MDDRADPWLTRALRIVVVTEWAALFLGLLGSLVSTGAPTPLVLAGAFLGALFVGANTFVPADAIFQQGFRLEILVVAGALLTVASTTLTGGVMSPFLLLALTPTLLAAIAGGTRLGLTTSLLSAGLTTIVSIAANGLDEITANAGAIALFPLLALLVGQIRNLLVESEQRAASFEKASLQAEAEANRLSQANELLRRLTDVYADGSSNPVEIGRSALEAVVEAHPGSFATATLFDTEGPVIIARVGTDSPDLVRARIPLGDGDTTSGVVSIGTPNRLSAQERTDIDRLLRPVAVSFSNTMLLQDIAGAAVREERLRVARELHDEVGPALATLGLSLDLIAMQTDESHVHEQVEDVRTNLGGIVEDLRSIIADLRAEASGSLVDDLNRVASDLPSPPTIRIDVREHRPPRAAAGRQIAAVVVESVRNAYRHADASEITIEGDVDRSRVDIIVRDDGKGFDVDRIPDGHYGVMGMRERAERIGAGFEVASGAGGTAVRLTWKDSR